MAHLKKFLMVLSVVLSVLIIQSCSSENDYQALLDNQQFDKVNSYNSSAMAKFLYSVDSLNNTFPIVRDNSRFSISKSLLVVAADAGGSWAGKRIGSWAGGAIGSITANPFGTIIGYIGGGKAGSYIGEHLASMIASYYLEYVPSKDALAYSSCAINVGDTELEDSVGYIHNYAVLQLYQNMDKYIVGDTELDYDLLLNDCIDVYKSFGIYEPELETNTELRQAIIEYACQLKDISKNCGDINTGEDIVTKQVQLLQDFYDVPADDLVIYKEFGTKVLDQCSVMTNSQILDYSEALNEVISDSQLSASEKEEASQVAQIIVNSSVCWEN
jgi:hypothetical protein